MRITVFVHGSKERCLDAGEKAGLSGEALSCFAYAANEHEITYEVDPATGIATAVDIDGRSIAATK